MSNKTALITGASRRLGAAIARHLHLQGMDIVIHYNRSSREANALADELNALRPDSAMLVQADLNEGSAIEPVVNEAVNFNSRLDVLINNASSFYPTPAAQVTVEQWNDLLNTNLKAPFFLAKSAYSHLRRTTGCIINIADIHADKPLKNYPVYSIAKAGLVMLTRALAREFGPDVRVNAVSPGAIVWPEDMDEATREKITSRTILKRCGDPQDVADAIYYLINNAGYVTGEILVIDGGRSLYQ